MGMEEDMDMVEEVDTDMVVGDTGMEVDTGMGAGVYSTQVCQRRNIGNIQGFCSVNFYIALISGRQVTGFPLFCPMKFLDFFSVFTTHFSKK